MTYRFHSNRRFSLILSIAVSLIVAQQNLIAQTTATWDNGQAGDQSWDSPMNWNPDVVPNNDDENSYDVVVDVANIDLGSNITVSSMDLNQGGAAGVTINGSGQSLEVEGTTLAEDVHFLGSGQFTSAGVNVTGSVLLGGAWLMNPGPVMLGTGAANGEFVMQDTATLILQDTFDILKDGDFLNFGGTPDIQNSGAFRKSGGTDLSNIAVRFEDVGGTISAASGLLKFNNTSLLGSTVTPSNSAVIQFSGPTEVSSLTLSPADFGKIEFDNATVTLGTITGSGSDLSTIIAKNGGSISGGSINMSMELLPFVIEGPSIDGVTNLGFCEWRLGKVTGSGLTNNSGATLNTAFAGIGTPTIENATLTNNGNVFVDRTIGLRDNGKIDHLSGEWTFRNGSAGINTQVGGNLTGLFTHVAPIVLDAPGDFTSHITCPMTSTGRFDIKNGELRLNQRIEDKMVLDGNIIAVDGGNGHGATFTIGNDSLSRSTLKNASITVTSNGVFQWAGTGIHKIEGELVSGGVGTAQNTGVTLLAEASTSADLRFDAAVPFHMNSNNANLQADGTITNKDHVKWSFGAVTGTGQFINDSNATIDVDANMRISRGDISTLCNNGMILLTGLSFQGITLDSFGFLQNEVNGTIQFRGDQDVFPLGDGGLLRNDGLIEKKFGSGESLIHSEFRQNAGGTLRSRSGTITLDGETIDLLGGTVSANSNGAAVLVANSSRTINVAFDFAEDAVVEYANLLSSTVHEIDGTLTGSGLGKLVFSGGTMKPREGFATLNFDEPSEFHQFNGTLNEVGKRIFNMGDVLMTGGTVVGEYFNQIDGNFVLDGGTVTGDYSNEGIFSWGGGTIDAQFSNDANGGIVDIDGTNNVLLAADSQINNQNQILHTGSGRLQLGENAELINANGSEYIFSGGANIEEVASQIQNARVTNTGRIANAGSIDSSINVKVSSTGGMFETTGAGDLNINGAIGEQGGQPVINGGTFKPGPSQIHTFFADLQGAITHDLQNSNGVVEHANAEVDATLIATGQGLVRIDDAHTPDGGGLFELVTSNNGSLFELTGTLDIATAATTTGGTVTFKDTKYNLFRNGELGTFEANSNLTFDNNSSAGGVVLSGPESGDRQDFILAAERTACLIGTTDLRLDGFIEFQNQGTFEIKDIGRGIASLDFAGTHITNNGTFHKTATSGGLSLVNPSFASSGTVKVSAGTLAITDCETLDGDQLEDGTWIVESGATLGLDGGSSTRILENDATIRLIGTGVFSNLPTGSTTDLFANDGTLSLEDDAGGTGATFITSGEYENNGTTNVSANSTLSVGDFDNDGNMNINGTFTHGAVEFFQRGTLSGTGTVNGNRIINQGTTSPGNSPGMLIIDGEFVNDTTGILDIELGGLTPGLDHDVLMVTQDLTLDGTLLLSSTNEFMPQTGQSFDVITANNITGTFSEVLGAGQYTILVGSNTVTVTVDCAPGDNDCDGDVDLDDYKAFAECLNGPLDVPSTSCLQKFDLDADGDIDAQDFQVMQQFLGGP